jgi:hypothetical protein
VSFDIKRHCTKRGRLTVREFPRFIEGRLDKSAEIATASDATFARVKCMMPLVSFRLSIEVSYESRAQNLASLTLSK